jgi:hypothetical protein
MYNIKYKRFLFWKTIRNVVADGYIDDREVRYFILEDNSIIEISTRGTMFEFPPERSEVIKKNKQEK